MYVDICYVIVGDSKVCVTVEMQDLLSGVSQVEAAYGTYSEL